MTERPLPQIFCPTCKNQSTDRKFFPFCCDRCKQIDFGAWATEQYKVSSPITADENEDEVESGA